MRVRNLYSLFNKENNSFDSSSIGYIKMLRSMAKETGWKQVDEFKKDSKKRGRLAFLKSDQNYFMPNQFIVDENYSRGIIRYGLRFRLSDNMDFCFQDFSGRSVNPSFISQSPEMDLMLMPGRPLKFPSGTCAISINYLDIDNLSRVQLKNSEHLNHFYKYYYRNLLTDLKDEDQKRSIYLCKYSNMFIFTFTSYMPIKAVADFIELCRRKF